jgi:hypothetical protein
MDAVEQYLEKTGQEFKDLMAGAATYGPAFIENTLVPKALEENKKIVWVPDLVEGEDLGRVKYELQDI